MGSYSLPILMLDEDSGCRCVKDMRMQRRNMSNTGGMLPQAPDKL